MIPYGSHFISEEEISAVVKVLKNEWLTQGEQVPAFEQGLCNLTDAKNAVAVNSATSALHLSCLALDVAKGDVVWVPANTFVATANCARYCGASVEFVDIDIATGNISVASLQSMLLHAEKSGRLPKVVIAVHFAGTACEMETIHSLSKKYQFKIIEDASHATGASYPNGGKIGNSLYSDITVFSFHPVKVLTTAEGGASLTNDNQLAERIRRLRNHGIDRDLKNRGNSWEFDQTELGFNFRMPDVLAAIGNIQLQRLEGFLNRRREIAARYYDELAKRNIDCVGSINNYSSFHLFGILLDDNQISEKQNIFVELRQQGIGVNVHYKPVYLNSYYQTTHSSISSCASAEMFYKKEISIPIYPELTDIEFNKVVSVLETVLEKSYDNCGNW